MKKQSKNNDTRGGIILILVGLFLLINQFASWRLPESAGFLILPAIAAVMWAAGFVMRDSGYFVPAGIIGGLGMGIIAETNPFNWLLLSDLPEGAPFMFAFAVGWLSIVVMSAVIGDDWHWWAFIPATIFALIGGTVAFGGVFEVMLSALGKGWPIILIAIGLKSLFSRQATTNL